MNTALLPIMVSLILIGLVGLFSYFSILEPNEGKPLKKQTEKWSFNFKIIFLISAVLHAILAFVAYGHEHQIDMNDFNAWSGMLASNGTFTFYTSGGLTDYPPGYMYILFIFGWIRRITHIDGAPYVFLLKLPSIICTLCSGGLVYRLSREKFDDSISVAISSFLLFNPAYYLNSVLWGQVDTIYAFVLVLMLVSIYKKQFIRSYFLFAIGILIKLQSVMLTPILAFAIIEEFFIKKNGEPRNTKLIIKNLLYGLGAIAAMFVLFVPFGVGATITQYIDTLSSYPHMTVNAFNMWNVLGMNWSGIDSLDGIWEALGIHTEVAFASVLGFVFIAIIVLICAKFYFSSKQPAKIFYLSAFLFLSSYMFSTRMHERYAFPALLCLLVAYVVTPNRRNMLTYLLNSAFSFLSCAWVLYVYETDINTYAFCATQRVLSLINIIIYVLFILALKADIKPEFKKRERKHPIEALPLCEGEAKLTTLDKKAIAIITGVYAVIALIALGGFNTPQTEYTLTTTPITVNFDGEQDLDRLAVYLGPTNLTQDQKITLQFKDSNGRNVGDLHELQEGSVFSWSHFDIFEKAASVDIASSMDNIHIMSAIFLDDDNNAIIPTNANDFSGLFDETDTYTGTNTLFNSTYFDEIYHARTGYEFIKHYPVYEWTHPPLGKVFISLGILIFGMNPFGWRIIGTLFGVAMIPFVYIFVKRLFKKSWLAVLGALLYTFDFMHYAQTRISTIDVYVTFFIILMYLIIYKFYDTGMFAEDRKGMLRNLALCGVCFGLGVACKWTGLYAGMGLAIIWLIVVIKGYLAFANAKLDKNGTQNGLSNKQIIEEFVPRLRDIIITCVLFFIVVPLIIYFIAYIPYMLSSGGISLKTIIDNQASMFTYHGKTVVESTHPYSSKWYQWLFMVRPIWYYSHTYSDTVKGGISSFGNPLVWWGGLVALGVNVYLIVKHRDKVSIFLIIGYLAQLLPWMLVERTTYIYHYFPAVIFLVLMIANTFNYYFTVAPEEGRAKVRTFCIRYVAVAIVLFILFYPVLSGVPVVVKYVEIFLKWFPSWTLI